MLVVETPARIRCQHDPEITVMRMAEVKVCTAVVVITGLLVACRGPVPPVPGKGGPTWIELTSPHFTIWTDGDLDRARELVRKMERMRLILVYAVFPTAPAEGRDLAIVLRDDAELRAFSETDQIRPFAVPAQFPLWQPMIVLSASSKQGALEVALAHELTHAISFGAIHHQPRWLAEGMATYFETVGLDPTLGTVDIGGLAAVRSVGIADFVPISELFEWTKVSKEETRQYSTAWMLFWFLISQHGAELQRYAHLLDGAGAEIKRRPDLARRIWDVVFPTLPLTVVDRELHHWIFNGSSVVTHLTLKARDWSATERRLGDADVYAIRALLRGLTGGRDAQARADVAAALAVEPTNVLAHLLAASLGHIEITADDARAIAAVHEDDWRAWMLVAGAVQDSHIEAGEAEAARARACEIIAANPALLPPRELLCPGRRAGP
jgi:hypothetical protein